MDIFQFSYKIDYPLPKSEYTVDCRIIPNPHSKAATPEGRKAIARQDPHFEDLVLKGIGVLKKQGWVAVGCLYGRDRSGAVAEEISKRTGGRILKWTEREVK